MILKTSLTAVAVAVLATGLLAQQASTTSPQQTPSKPAVVSLIGCVERVAATAPTRGTTPPATQAPAYRLIDVQPGTGTVANLKPNSQFLLAVAPSVSTPIDLGKLQNQWVEVTGTISPVPSATVTPQATAPPTGQAAPLPTFTTTAVKVISTECK